MRDFFNSRLRIIQGDITKLQVDAVVNAANSSLMGGGGVDGAIHRSGGPSILRECKKIRKTDYPDGLPAGKAVCTAAGSLPAKAVIHTVGPVWKGGNAGEEILLKSAYTSSLFIAAERGFKSVAFPAISTGVYSFPKEKAAVVAFSAVEDFISASKIPEQIIFVFFDSRDLDIFIQSVT